MAAASFCNGGEYTAQDSKANRPADIPKDEKLGDPPRGANTGAPGAAGAAAGRGTVSTAGAAGAAARGSGARGGGGSPLSAEARAYNAAKNERTNRFNSPASSGVLYVGTKGYITSGEYGEGPRIVPAAKTADYQAPPPFLTRSQETYTDWIQSCKSGNPSASNFGVAGPFTEWIAMGCIACRVPGKLEWDPEKMRITNNKEANKFVKPTLRKGWSFT